jgi:membrane protease YdiL (CAAX protease family)
MLLLYAGVAAYIGKLYWEDVRNHVAGNPNPGALPGAVPCSGKALWIALTGALVLLGLETGGEIILEIDSEQSRIAAAFLIAMLGAGIVEEVIFRGYLFVAHRGRIVLLTSICVFSIIFALLHPHLWHYESGEGAWWAFWQANWSLDFGAKAWFTTAFLFFNSLWFYACRFAIWNPQQSILPCFAAHAFSNLGVFCIKWIQGFVVFFVLILTFANVPVFLQCEPLLHFLMVGRIVPV